MGGGKVKRLKSVKGKRWKKGHSSDSNPIKRQHRDAAKSRYFNVSTGPSDLTVDALAKHDAEAASIPDSVPSEAAMDTQSVGSIGGKTFNTWATNWTDCTNATFNRVHRYWASNSAMHKEILAILAAITEVIKQQGGKETETEYFAALMTTLDTVEEESSVSAVLYLLSLVLKRVPVSVLKKRFSETAKMLMEILGTHADSDYPALVKSAIHCLAQLLRVQEQAVWNASSTMQVYKGLLSFVTHAKPKVRKSAQEAVRIVLKTPPFLSSSPSSHHPAAAATANYCNAQIEAAGADATITLHLLGLLQHLLGTFPQNSLKATCETILRAMTLANVVVTSVALKALHGLFSSKPSSNTLPPQLNAQIITALYDFQPGDQDTQPMSAWLTVMETAHVNLALTDCDLCLSHLPRMVACCMQCLLRADSAEAAANTLNSLFKSCLGGDLRSKVSSLISSGSSSSGSLSPVHKVVRSLEGGLSYQYHATWGNVLTTIASFFKTLGAEIQPLSKKLLLSMCDLRDSPNFPYRSEVDAAVGAAVKSMGPKAVLDAVPLQITGEEDNYEFPRSWLVPVIRDNVTNTQMAYFTAYFLPLAAKLRTKSLEYEFGGRTVEAQSYDALQSQIWSMLPGFCTQPTDLPQSFRSLAKILGSALSERADLRLTVLSALRKLIQYSLTHEESRAEMSRFAKNFIPILFNLYTADPETERDPKRMAVLETAKVYFQVADKSLIATFFERCLAKMGEDDTQAFTRHALMDLSLHMVPHVHIDQLLRLYPIIKASLSNKDKTIQKKAYRILEEVCSSESEACKTLIARQLLSLQTTLTESLSSSSPSSKAPRLRCLVHILNHLDSPQIDFVNAVVPEAILCTKEVAEKARNAAYNLLGTIGTTLCRWQQDTVPKEEVIRQYFEMLLAGLGGSPHMVSCTVLAITRVLYEFKADLASSILMLLVDATCLLLRSKSREIVTPAVAMLKVLLAVVGESKLAQFLKQIIESLVTMKEDNKHHLRFRNKEIYAKLIRKFGYEVILKLVPQSHHKILVNIKKTTERNKKKQKQHENSDGEEEEEKTKRGRPETIDDLLRDTDSELDDGEDEEVDKKSKKKTAGKKRKDKGSAAYIKEEGDEDIVDFLDPTVNKKVLATKPSKASIAAKIKHDFKMSSDGRMIITEDKEEEGDGKKKGTKKRRGDEDEDDLEDLLEALGGGLKKGKKKKMAGLEGDDEAMELGYKPGGSGIHRQLGSGRQQQDEPSPGGEFRAKKAKGDLKKKGKVDPYAYVPLQISNLNRRKKAKLKGQFSNLVKGAKKGSMKGKKMRNKAK